MNDTLVRKAWLVLAGVLLSAGVSADEQSAIERCRHAGDDQQRIACLEAAIRELTGDVSVQQNEPDQIDVEAVATRDDPEPAEVVEHEPLGNEPLGNEPIENEVPVAPVAETVVDTPADAGSGGEPMVAAESPPEPQSQDAAVADIGQEQVEALTRTREEHLAGLEAARGLQVESFEYVGYQKLQVRLENGQIWRQIRGDVQEIRVSVGRNPTVDITESSIGGYRLRLNEIRRTIRVRRVR